MQHETIKALTLDVELTITALTVAVKCCLLFDA